MNKLRVDSPPSSICIRSLLPGTARGVLSDMKRDGERWAKRRRGTPARATGGIHIRSRQSLITPTVGLERSAAAASFPPRWGERISLNASSYRNQSVAYHASQLPLTNRLHPSLSFSLPPQLTDRACALEFGSSAGDDRIVARAAILALIRRARILVLAQITDSIRGTPEKL